MKKGLFVIILMVIGVSAISQDLVVTGVDKTSVIQYADFDGILTIKNTGIITAGASRIILMLSQDAVLGGTDDKYFYGIDVPVLAAGTSKDVAICCANTSSSPGTYTLFITADHQKVVTETDETNNTLAIPNFTITSPSIDFFAKTLTTGKTSYAPYNFIDATMIVEKSGTELSGEVHMSYYLSKNTVWDTNDTYVGFDFKSLDGADAATITSKPYQLLIPTMDAGTYYLIGQIDRSVTWERNNAFAEANETNNTVVSTAITITVSNVDLEPFGLEVEIGGEAIKVARCTMMNHGTTGVAGYNINYYISSDAVLDGSDQDIYDSRYRTGPEYWVRPASQLFLDERISYTPGPGIHYLIMVVNPDSRTSPNEHITEANKSNNTVVSAPFFTVPQPPPALTINASFVGSYDYLDKNFDLNVKFKNEGAGHALTTQFYSVVIKNSSGQVLHTLNKNESFNLAVNASVTKPWTLTLPQPLAYGSYTVEIKCSSSTGCFTTSQTIQLTIDAMMHELVGYINAEGGVILTKGTVFLYKKGSDGTVRLANQVAISAIGSYTFMVDDIHEHTVYVVPDRVQYPQFVPTIYEKALVLSDQCFFKAQGYESRNIYPRKITPQAPGESIINGTLSVKSSSSGRTETASFDVNDVPVILLSEADKPLALTFTDENGNYKFEGLPAGKYKVLISSLFITGNTSIVVDISQQNKTANIEVGQHGITTHQTIYYKNQVVTFSELAGKTYGDAPFTPAVSTDSGLPVVLISSNEAVARIENGTIFVVGAGETMISASQAGNAFYQPASVTQVLIVEKAVQQIAVDEITTKTFGEEPFAITATTSSALPVSLISSDNSILSISSGVATIHKAGVVSVQASQPGNENYLSGEETFEIEIRKAGQQLTFSSIGTKTIQDTEFDLEAAATSSLPITFTSDNTSVAEVSGKHVSINGPGEAIITAYQGGNENYLEAQSVSQILLVELILAAEETGNSISIFPNPSSGVFFIYDEFGQAKDFLVIDGSGKQRTIPAGESIDITDKNSGLYLLKVNTSRGYKVFKIIKK